MPTSLSPAPSSAKAAKQKTGCMTKTDFSPMKKIFALAGLVTAAVISLTNCQPKELGTDVPVAGKTVLIKASMDADTKTTADGMSTLWAEGDKINLFYGSSYTSLGEVTIAEGVGTKQAAFQVTGAPSGSVKWYAIYPYNSKLETPAEQTASYTYIGHSKGLTQDGFDNTSALCGNVCPLYGIAEGTAEEVNLPMKHLASAIELNLTNNSGSAIVVNSVTITASENIVGSYYIDIVSDPIVYTPSGDNYVKTSAIVNMEDGTLSKGESGKVYFAVKPYTQSESVPFVVTVKATVGGADKIAEIELNPKGNQCVFTAGKMKQINVNIDSFGEDQGNTIADIHSGNATGSVTVKNVTVTSLFPKGYFVYDGKDILYVYQNAELPSDIAVGKKVNVSGTVSTYKGNKQISSPTATVVGSGSASLTPASWNGSKVDAAYVDGNAAYVTLDMNTTSTTLAGVDGASKVLYFPSAQKAAGVTIAKDKTYTVVGYIYGHALYSGSEQVYIYIESASEKITSATLTVSPTSVNIEQAGGSAEATVTCDNNNWSIDTSTVPDWLTATKGSGKITFSASANNETKRSATVTLKHSNGSITATVKVSQEGAVETETLTLGAASVSFTEEGGVKEVNVTCNASGDWSIDNSTVPSWITATADKENKKIILNAQANTGSAREGTIVVNHSNGELSRNLAVSQAAKSTGGTVTYVKVNSVVDGGQYLIVSTYTKNEVEYNRAFNGALSTLDAASNFVDVTVSSNKITTNKDCYFIYNASEGSFKSASGVYVAAKGTEDANGMSSPSEYSEDICKMTVSFDSDGNVTIAAPSKSVLRYNYAAGQDRFRFYKSSTYESQQPIQLYKKQ